MPKRKNSKFTYANKSFDIRIARRRIAKAKVARIQNATARINLLNSLTKGEKQHTKTNGGIWNALKKTLGGIGVVGAVLATHHLTKRPPRPQITLEEDKSNEPDIDQPLL